MTKPLEREMQIYNENLQMLLGHAGKFVLIHGETVDGFFEAYADAIRAGYAAVPTGRFLVKRIAHVEQVSFFTRDLVFECRQ